MALDAAIIIPSHKEGADILHCLASIARQRGIEGQEIGVFVVINQAHDALAEICRSNAETADVIRSLQVRKLPENLSETKRELDPLQALAPEFGSPDEVIISQREAAEQILQSGLQIHEVNLWEGDNAPRICNVGIARHHGTVEAISHLKDDNRPVLGTDADAIFGVNKVKNVIELFETDPQLMAARGDLHLLTLNSPQDRRLRCATQLRDFHSLFSELQAVLTTLLTEKTPYVDYVGLEKRVKPSKKEEQPWTFDGINTNFRASVYKRVQFREIPGEEDTLFGKELVEAGYTIWNFGRKLSTATFQRFSDRALTGLGRELEENTNPYISCPGRLPVPSMAAVRLKVAICKTLRNYNGFSQGTIFGNFEQVVECLSMIDRNTECAKLQLTKSEIYELITILMESQGLIDFSTKLSELSEKIRSVPIDQAFVEIIQFITTMTKRIPPRNKMSVVRLKLAVAELKERFDQFKREMTETR